MLHRTFVSSSTRAVVGVSRRALASSSVFGDIPLAPPDPILGLTAAFNADKHPAKMSLGVGAYRDDNGKPFVLQCVREAEKRIVDAKMDCEYAGIDGVPAFREVALQLAYGTDSQVLNSKRVASAQSISGTGALRVAGEFLNRFVARNDAKPRIYVPTPTWGNHLPIFGDAGLEVTPYRYYDAANISLDLNGMIADLEAAPAGSIVLLHACAHNPTGVDPDAAQWADISAALKAKGHFVLLDMAYQGFASGDPTRDATALHTLVADGHDLMLCQSFAKNFGLYGQRVGMWSMVCRDSDECDRVQSQVKRLIRPMYSNPPIHGARIVSTVLRDAELDTLWRQEVASMASRIIDMRQLLRERLVALGSQRNWSHIEKQIGMFCFSGLTPEQVDTLRDDWSIYMTRDGRISMAGVTTKNVDRLAEGIHAVTSA